MSLIMNGVCVVAGGVVTLTGAAGDGPELVALQCLVDSIHLGGFTSFE